MTDDMQTLRDDIAYLKAMADSGQGRSATGGAILMAAGGFFGAASLLQWAALTGLVPLSPATASLAWLVATLAFLVVLTVVKLRWRSEGTTGGAAGMAWQGVGVGCFVIFAAIFVATWRTQNALLVQFSPSIIFILYGAAWMVAAATLRRLWLHLTAWGSFAASLVTAWFIGDPVSYLLYAIGLVLLAFLPGLAFMLSARGRGE